MTKVFWMSGGMHDRKLTLDKIKSQFPSAEVVIVEGAFTVAYLEHVVRQESCFVDERIVLVKNMPYPSTTRPTMLNHLKKLIDTIPDTCVLVFDGIFDEKAISAHVGKVGKLFITDEKITINNGVAWIQSVLDEYGKSIGDNEAILLMETCGYDKVLGGIGVDIMRIACEKLSFYLGRRKSITADDVLNASVPSQDFVIWRTFDAMDARDICACHNAYTRLCDQEQSVIGATTVLFAISLPRYRMMLFLKENLATGITKQEAVQQALSIPKLTSQGKDWEMTTIVDMGETGQKMAFSEFAVNAAVFGNYGRKPSLELYSRRDIVRIINALYIGSSEIRARGNSDVAAKILVDSLFLAVCTNIDDNIIAKLREPYNYV